MTAGVIIAAVNAGLALIESLLPVLRNLRLSGAVSIAEQREVLDKYEALKAKADEVFAAPEWKIDP